MKTAAISFLMLPALLFTASVALSGPHIHKEAYYRDLWCQVNHGDTEQRQPNGTIADCVTGSYAVEVEFAEKWQHAIGQSLNYSNQIEKKAGIVLILETDADLKYWNHLQELVDALDEKGAPIQLWRIGPGAGSPRWQLSPQRKGRLDAFARRHYLQIAQQKTKVVILENICNRVRDFQYSRKLPFHDLHSVLYNTHQVYSMPHTSSHV